MWAYGIQPSELQKLGSIDRQALYHHIPRLQARQRLQFILDVRAAMSGKEADSSDFMRVLVDQAFGDDPDCHVVALEAITRSS
jgi:hypothetical protein